MTHWPYRWAVATAPAFFETKAAAGCHACQTTAAAAVGVVCRRAAAVRGAADAGGDKPRGCHRVSACSFAAQKGHQPKFCTALPALSSPAASAAPAWALFSCVSRSHAIASCVSAAAGAAVTSAAAAPAAAGAAAARRAPERAAATASSPRASFTAVSASSAVAVSLFAAAPRSSAAAAAAAAARCCGVCPPLLRLSPLRFAKTGPSRGRGPLLAKFAPKGFKKGFGAVGLGRHTKKGFFIINTMLVPSFKVPDLSDCKLKCYVSPKAFRIVQQGFLSRSAPGYQEEKGT